MVDVERMLKLIDELGYEYDYVGDAAAVVSGASPLRNYRPGTITWLKNHALVNGIPDDIFLLVTSERDASPARNLIVTSEPKKVFFQIVNHFFADGPPAVGIGEGTVISESVKIGAGVSIGCNCTIKGDVTIGDGVTIGHNVTVINDVTIGAGTEILSGAVIGHDGFGWFDEGGKHEMIRHIGGVNIGSGVFIGANTIVSRGALDDTVIGDGCRIDGQVYIAHNVILGNGVIVVGRTGFGGSVTVGADAYISTSSLLNQITVGEGAFVGWGSVVIQDVAAGSRVAGNPARSIKGL
jgi:UDP-3-O-[3-hydroxymyristoyl] glucosamine N-acyltransferase